MPLPLGSYRRKGGRSLSASKQKTPTFEKNKSVSYSATQSDAIFSVSSDASSSASESLPNAIELANTGTTPVFVMTAYETYSGDGTDAGKEHLHTLLMPGEVFSPPIIGVIATGADTVIVDGTPVDNEAPNSNEYTDSTGDLDSATADGVVGDATDTTVYLEPYTSAANCTANLFRVGDLIRIRDEVMEVTGIGAKAALATNTLTVIRGVHGSTAGTAAADDDPIRLPFFNAYHDYDKYSVAQTDMNGKFKAMNMFGYGRAATGNQGITPGSFSMKFYEAGYQAFGMSGITSSTNSGLAASTAYAHNITVDGGSTFANLSFTTDSSNLNFGGASGIIQKIQNSLDTQFYTAGNLFEKKVHVAIVDGDIRFTSGQHLSTSAMLLAAPGSGTTPFGVGRIPAIANINAAVAARLPDDTTYDRVTYASVPNNVFCYDDGYGNLTGMGCTGTINYETGAIDIQNAPPNAEFVFSVMHSTAFSGKLNEGGVDRENTLAEIYVNSPSQKASGNVNLKVY